MAEGEGHLRRNLSEQSLQSLEQDGHNITKEEAIAILQKIINCEGDGEIGDKAKKLLKQLQESDKNPGESLSQSERSEFIQIDKHFRAVKNFIQVLRHLEIGVQQRGVITSKNEMGHLEAMEERLESTKSRLQDALDRINVLNQDLAQIRTDQSSERSAFQSEIRSMRDEKNKERSQFEQDIRNLKAIINKLEEDKRTLEQQIKELRIEMNEERAINEKYKQDQAQLVEKLNETNMKELKKLRTNVDELMEENKKLKTRYPYKLVGYGVTLITNALYKYVHSATTLRKNYYSIDILESHLANRYRGDEQGRHSAQRRWDDIKTTIGWNDSAPALLNQLAENREKGPSQLSVSVNYHEFSDAVRSMFNDKEIDQNEMELIRDLFVKCNDNLPMQVAPRN